MAELLFIFLHSGAFDLPKDAPNFSSRVVSPYLRAAEPRCRASGRSVAASWKRRRFSSSRRVRNQPVRRRSRALFGERAALASVAAQFVVAVSLSEPSALRCLARFRDVDRGVETGAHRRHRRRRARFGRATTRCDVVFTASARRQRAFGSVMRATFEGRCRRPFQTPV